MSSTLAALGALRVEVAFHAVAGHIGPARHDQLVLRRTVRTESDEGCVEQLWVSPRLPILAARRLLDAVLDRPVERLVLAQPVADLPGMDEAAAARLDELDAGLGEPSATRLLVACRGRVDAHGRANRLRSAEIVSGPGLAGHRARSRMTDALARLGLVASPDGDPGRPADDAPDTDGTGIRGANAAAAEAHRPISGPAGTAAVSMSGPLTGVGDLARASAAARTRLAQAGQWLRRPAAQPTIAPLLGQLVFGQGPAWLRLERPTQPSVDPAGQRPTGVMVTFVGGTGGVIGPGGLQTNLFQYKMSPRIDLAGALTERAVREAFAAYATHASAPDADPAVSAVLRAAAVESLRNALPGGETDWRAGERPAGPRQTPISTRVPTLEGTVVLQDDCGVQVGNRVRQYNTFGYVLAPNVRTGALLQQDPLLAGAIVDHACDVSGPAFGSVQQCLADAVCGSAEAGLARPAGAGVHELPATVVRDVGVLAGAGAGNGSTRR